MPQYTNNYEFEAMDLDGDGFLDLVTMNDGEIVGEDSSSRREHVFRNDGKGRYRDATDAWWPAAHNVGEDDNMAAFLDFDSDGDADIVVGSLSGPDRLLINDGQGRLTVALDVFDGEPTPGTLGLALADLDGDHRMDVVQGQGEHKTAIDERVFAGRGLKPDTAAPSVSLVALTGPRPAPAWSAPACTIARARASRRSGSAWPWNGPRPAACVRCRCAGTASTCGGPTGPQAWMATASYRVCATDAAGNTACAAPDRDS